MGNSRKGQVVLQPVRPGDGKSLKTLLNNLVNNVLREVAPSIFA